MPTDQTWLSSTRRINQQLTNPGFEKPSELVAWMGAMQAQAYDMAQWAVGLRLKNGSLATVHEALNAGSMLRIHLMRPTWHWVAAQDIRWMVSLSAERLRAANDSYGKSRHRPISPALYSRVDDLLGRMLEGKEALTKPEIATRLAQAGIETQNNETTRYLLQAETRGLICSGPDKTGKPTYAWMDDRVPPTRELSRSEALGTLALRYFQSHSPATLADFVWWSGLSLREARQAVGEAGAALLHETTDGTEWMIHEKAPIHPIPRGPHREMLLLPPFDEYLIGYKNRTHVLDPAHQSKAFNRWGTFYPVILHQGRIIGSWEKGPTRKAGNIDIDFFPGISRPDESQIHQAIEQYRHFLSDK